MKPTLKPLLPAMFLATSFAAPASLLFGASLMAMVAPAAHAQDELAYAQNPLAVQSYGAATYVNGGVGKNESDAMRGMAEQYPLRMMFSERKDDEFVVRVAVVIVDGHGKQVFELSNAGPLLYVKLPDGRYKVSARFKDRTESRDVTIASKNGKDLYFHWNAGEKA